MTNDNQSPSPYHEVPEDEWPAVTQQLIAEYPLTIGDLRFYALEAWGLLWKTRIGDGNVTLSLQDANVGATVVGAFFERLLARGLEAALPDRWRGGTAKREKDLVYIPDSRYSTEIKCSGQLKLAVFGNRSFNQRADAEKVQKPEKSGFYLTANFYQQSLMLLRFGWIDSMDWIGQPSQTGQAAKLSESVYRAKLVEIPGKYRLDSPIEIIAGVGPSSLPRFRKEGIVTVADLLKANSKDGAIQRVQERVRLLAPQWVGDEM